MQLSCVNPGAVQDWELEAHADGEALPHVVEHLNHCPACRARLKENALFERGLLQVLYRFDCPSADRLRDFWWDHLPAKERRQIQVHLDTCPHCVAELAELTEFVATEPEEPADTLLARARQLAAEMRLVVASLVSPGPRRAWALRGETKEVLLFDAEGMALSINLEQEEPGTYTLFGQVLSQDLPFSAGGYARLTARGQVAAPVHVSLDACGSFALPDLRPGVYQLLVCLPDQRIVVPLLALKAEL